MTLSKIIIRCLVASVLILTSQTFTSCIKDEVVATSPQCAITSFSVGSIKSYVPVKKYDAQGNATDTLIARTISGSDIHFNIDQVNRRIYTVDSLPVWTELSHVVPTFTCYGNVLRQSSEDKLYYVVTSGQDSLDFSRPTELMCVATDGMSSKTYTVELRKASVAIDTLEWTYLGSTLAMSEVCKVLNSDGALTAFGKDLNGNIVCSSTTNGKQWSEVASVGAAIDAEAVVLFRGRFYSLDADKNIVGSDNGKDWTVVSQQKADRLLTADQYYIYAIDGSVIIGSSDFENWTVQGGRDIAMLPQTDISSCTHTSLTNDGICVSVLTGINADADNVCVAWYKLSSDDDFINQQWAYIEPATDNPYSMPQLSNISVARYGDALYLIGTTGGKYKSIYRSKDNGITWQTMSSNYAMPLELNAANGRAHLIADGGSLWIVQANGNATNVWKGAIR